MRNTPKSAGQTYAIVGLLSLLTGCVTVEKRHTRYEYRVDVVEPLTSPRSGLAEHLNKYASDGWEMSGLTRDGSWVVVMRRPIPKETP